MKIAFVDIQNFRKLKNCRIDLSDEQTVLVGPNNSGKTSAMDALILFLRRKNKFTTRDFTLSNWKEINSIGENWLASKELKDVDFTFDKWAENIPSLDVWLNVESEEIHYVNNLIPTLDWKGGLLGVRLTFEPKDLKSLYQEFSQSIAKSNKLETNREKGSKVKLGPKNLWEFLDQKNNLSAFFEVNSYLLNPEKNGSVQKLLDNSVPLEKEAFKGLVRVDIINAQRGFGERGEISGEETNDKILSNQLRSYYDKHLNPSIDPTPDDIKALDAIHGAKELFDQNLKESFKSSLEELEFLNYPGFGNPKISLSSNFNTIESINHDSSVQYNLDDNIPELSLPEKYNGLGYQNLISIIFKLIRFRDEWMQVGKLNKDKSTEDDGFEPIHLVLIEEPEAHLHAQVQQVFIKQAYTVLRNNESLKSSSKFNTQVLISTHSNHIAHEIDFTSLRYFKRIIGEKGKLDTSTVVNLSRTFGTEDDTTKFSIRYLKTTHCDLFFADAVILVEGPVERMLIPHFISQFKNSKDENTLSKCYISILEIGGSHAHRLKNLIEALGIISLIITDLDSIEEKSTSKTQPDKGKKYRTGNDTLKTWLPGKTVLDELLGLDFKDKEHDSYPIRVAYQIPLTIDKEVVYPYTFEDSLVIENKATFQKIPATSGLLKIMKEAATEANVKRASKHMYDAITKTGVKKAEFALELLFLEEPENLKSPKYIEEGLSWLEEKLATQKVGLKK